ncbi:hypothetical protein GCM10017673_49810 [Streptosporangium violaceochromogenes]|nr:hypothetical protein GCM10017673_49810 [Streptosporangium violaceochromogenes]
MIRAPVVRPITGLDDLPGSVIRPGLRLHPPGDLAPRKGDPAPRETGHRGDTPGRRRGGPLIRDFSSPQAPDLRS